MSNKDSQSNDLRGKNEEQISSHQVIMYSGPLPHPHQLQAFDDIEPGFADRIIALTEKQSAHRQEIEQSVVKGETKRANRGQIFAFCLCLLAFTVTALTAYWNYPALAAVIATETIFGIGYIFVKEKNKLKEPSEE